MKNKRILLGIIFAALVVLTSNSIFARDAIYEDEQYNINLSYSETSKPGDAVFIRMKIVANKNLKRTKDSTCLAKVVLSDKKKEISHTSFFNMNPTRKNTATVELFAALPLSSWMEAGSYNLSITYEPFDLAKKEFSLPLTVEAKAFDEEIIPLSQENTDLRTDTSAERMAQIAKLNAIFATVNPDGVHSFEKFMLPVESTRRTSGFADRRTYKYSTGKTDTTLHYGVDFGVPTGTKVMACSAGKVVLAENRISTGWSVVIEHLPGLYSIYYHMSELNVKENQMVKKGDLIGLSGATGMVTGPHLHWEIRLNMAGVNPDLFVQDFAFTE